MMEAQYKTKTGIFIKRTDVETPKDLFKWFAGIQEIFEAESECGCCKSQDIKFRVRTIDEYDFYELHCQCGARFQFGQNKGTAGTLFPKRDGPNGGWAYYEGAAQAAETKVVAPPPVKAIPAAVPATQVRRQPTPATPAAPRTARPQ